MICGNRNRCCRTRWYGTLILVSFVLLPGHVLLAESVDYLREIKPLLKQKCYSCHGPLKQEASLRLDTASSMRAGGDGGAAVQPGEPDSSLMFERITAEDEDERMPPEGEPLTTAQIALIRRWIDEGANAPANERPLTDPRGHWAFQPVKPVKLAFDSDHEGNVIDTFIRKRLHENDLDLAAPAGRVTLVRRMFLDLHGLPPTPDEVAQWSRRLQNDERAVAELVDCLLASPRYGERWAQHWLDIVRYADTHGFEVNTPRANAWPYRDYVIRAFNEDKPYDRFVFEQLAGDQAGEGAATGFLVAAAVLLPGQIGKDEASKRLARQDALDEIIVGTGATFLGLTIGCARCHDHKFDPISQNDYYAMQAFFAGVDYGDREIRDGKQKERQAEAAELADRINQLKAQLQKHQLTAFTDRTIVIDDEDEQRVTQLATKNGHGTNPAGTGQGYRDDVGAANRMANVSRGRYTWWDNKPGGDVFTWNPGVAGRFRLWVSWGVHGSGVHTRDARYLLDLDGDLDTKDDQTEIARADQYYFVGQSTGESEKKPLWSGLLDTGVHEIDQTTRLVLRGGETGTGITADVIVLQEESATEPETQAATPRLPRLRGPVSPLRTIERFPSVEAKFIRFTTFETIDNNRHEPCIDELEVFSTGKQRTNIALAEHGTIASSSGNYSETGIHQLKHVNDGQYGNGQSWISNQHGGGWVQLEFPQPAAIDEIVWGRDREGKFKDRLSVRYRIESSLDGKQWKTVATSDDRVAIGTPHDETMLLLRSSLSGDASQIGQSLKTAVDLEQRMKELDKPRFVYGGTFRNPDVTHVLGRGDPEQPRETIGPRIPQYLGAISLPMNAEEHDRRKALAEWIIDTANPLTARVMVNRIWQYHFGNGLVDTPSDFGLNGAQPSHPELLDWLAGEFIRSGWSVKHIHRLLLTSGSYQQSSRMDSRAQAIDADCKLLWRFPTRRIEAEAIRDSMLQLSGNLNLSMGGSGFSFFKTRGGLSGFPPLEDFGPNELRRVIYSHKIRMEPVPVFGAFDCPDAGQAMPTRSQSTTAIQALNLFNSPFVYEQAVAFAQRVERKSAPKPRVKLTMRFAWRSVVSRPHAKLLHPPQVVNEHGLATLCRVLLNSNEFLFIP